MREHSRRRATCRRRGILKLYDGDSGFEWNSWREWSATRAFADESFVFSVLQSISGVDPAWVSQQIAPFVD